jgi:hypothetical protein
VAQYAEARCHHRQHCHQRHHVAHTHGCCR